MADDKKLSKQYHYEYDITMTCGGCSGAIDRVLKRLQSQGKFSLCFSPKYSPWTSLMPLFASLISARIEQLVHLLSRAVQTFSGSVPSPPRLAQLVLLLTACGDLSFTSIQTI